MTNPVMKEKIYETTVVHDEDGNVAGALRRTEPMSPKTLQERANNVAKIVFGEKK